MFGKLKSAFSRLGKEAEKEVKCDAESSVDDTALMEDKSEKRGVLGVFTKTKLSEERFDDIFDGFEEELLQLNVAAEVVDLIRERLKTELANKVHKRRKLDDMIKETLREVTTEILKKPKPVKISFDKKPYIIMFVGVNGVGKTTTLAKLAKWLQARDKSCVFAAADTFRAASMEQLQAHADKLKIKMVKHNYGADPAAVAFDAISHAKARKLDVVLIDTAGRQQANKDLMDELAKINRVAKPDLTVLVVDSLTGNDAVTQVKMYGSAIGVDAVILTKSDADDRGGTVLSVAYVAEKPILFLGTGQSYGDFEEFKISAIVDKLFGVASE